MMPPELRSDEVQVWCAALDLEASRVQELLATLAIDEQARAKRFRFQKDRDHFIVARGLLRAILAPYLGAEPTQLRFCYGPHGKPALARESNRNVLRFNLSHSHGIALYAVTWGREIGIDVECIRTDVEMERIAERFFSPREVAMLRALPEDLRPEAFYNCWTRKEAFVKARGDGLALPLDQFDVSLAPGEAVALLDVHGDFQEAFRWSLQELNPEPGYRAALAVEGYDWQLKFCHWME